MGLFALANIARLVDGGEVDLLDHVSKDAVRSLVLPTTAMHDALMMDRQRPARTPTN